MKRFPVDIEVGQIPAEQAVTEGWIILDVRSPKEFAEGHAPGAVNLPLLGDDERAVVGTAYHNEGAGAARMRAVDLAAPKLPFLLRSAAVASRGGRIAVMCWRGGERSRNMVLLLGLAGIRAVRVEGGYRAYRRWVLDSLEGWRPPCPVVTLHGYTGSGKTDILRALRVISPPSDSWRPAVVDLEGLALHRGSLLGGLNQPSRRTQKNFDALVWEELRSLEGDVLFLEGEGGKIGHLFVPGTVAQVVRGGMAVLVDAPAEERVQRIMAEYDPGRWTAEERERFRESLERIASRLPPERVASLRRAFEDGRFDAVVRDLLEHYYDPLYERSSVGGREFVYVLKSTARPREDARRLLAALSEVRGERNEVD